MRHRNLCVALGCVVLLMLAVQQTLAQEIQQNRTAAQLIQQSSLFYELNEPIGSSRVVSMGRENITDGSTNTGVTLGQTGRGNSSLSNTAAYFDGTQQIHIPLYPTNSTLPLGSSPYTIAAWIKFNASVNLEGGVMGFGTPFTNNYQALRMSGGNRNSWSNFWWGCDGLYTISRPSGVNSIAIGFNDYQWHHLAITWSNDGQGRLLYFDGLSQSTDTPVGTCEANKNTILGSNLGSNLMFALGGTGSTGVLSTQTMKGWMQEVGVWATRLTAAEINVMFRRPPGAAAQLIQQSSLFYELNEPFGSLGVVSMGRENIPIGSASTNNAGITLGQPGRGNSSISNTAAYFDGSKQIHIKLSSTNSTLPLGSSPYTLAAWIKFNASSVNNQAGVMGFGLPATTNGYQALRIAGANINVWRNFWWGCDVEVAISRPSGVNSSSIGFNDNQWHHLAITWSNDGQGRLLYFDGLSQSTSTVPIPAGCEANKNTRLGPAFSLGGTGTFGVLAGQTMKGWMQEVGVWDTRLTAAEINVMFNRPPVTAAQLIQQSSLFYELNEPFGSPGVVSMGRENITAGPTNDGVTLGQTGRGNSSLSNTAAYFDGTKRILIPFSSTNSTLPLGSSPYTLAAWIKFSATGPLESGVMGFGATATTNGYQALRISGGDRNSWNNFWWGCDGVFTISRPSGVNSSSIGFNDNQWHHLAFTWSNDGQGRLLYFDGLSQSTSTVPIPAGCEATKNTILGSNPMFALGGTGSFGVLAGQTMKGWMQEVGVWATRLTAAEINVMFNRPSSSITVSSAAASSSSSTGSTISSSAPPAVITSSTASPTGAASSSSGTSTGAASSSSSSSSSVPPSSSSASPTGAASSSTSSPLLPSSSSSSTSSPLMPASSSSSSAPPPVIPPPVIPASSSSTASSTASPGMRSSSSSSSVPPPVMPSSSSSSALPTVIPPSSSSSSALPPVMPSSSSSSALPPVMPPSLSSTASPSAISSSSTSPTGAASISSSSGASPPNPSDSSTSVDDMNPVSSTGSSPIWTPPVEAEITPSTPTVPVVVTLAIDFETIRGSTEAFGVSFCAELLLVLRSRGTCEVTSVSPGSVVVVAEVSAPAAETLRVFNEAGASGQISSADFPIFSTTTSAVAFVVSSPPADTSSSSSSSSFVSSPGGIAVMIVTAVAVLLVLAFVVMRCRRASGKGIKSKQAYKKLAKKTKAVEGANPALNMTAVGSKANANAAHPLVGITYADLSQMPPMERRAM